MNTPSRLKIESQALNFMEAAMGRGCTSPRAVGQGKQA